MKLHELINTFIEGKHAVEYSFIHPYRKMLRVYFKDYFTTEPVLAPVMVANAVQYCLIIPSGELLEGLSMYDDDVLNDPELEELYCQYLQIL